MKSSHNAYVVTKFDRNSTYFSGQKLIWKNVITISIFHILAIYSFITFPYLSCWKTAVWAWAVAVSASFGVGAGAHRLWTHRSYKAKTPLKIILLLCYNLAGMNSIFNWVRDHRVHHKYSETDADPHNSKRGFFFSHVGWLMLRKHPEVLKKGRQIDMTDILNDSVVQFGEKYFVLLKILLCFILPTIIPVFLWNENWYYALLSQLLMRYSYVLNATWCVNSVAHMLGCRPYNKMIAPTENMLISLATGGEGWHNYHHVFPWDYKAAELGHFTDLSTYFIHSFAKIGWAYDLKQTSPDLLKSIVARRSNSTKFEVPPPEEKTQTIQR
ncbi:acyl-CoA Delta(11) desaturase-like [Copidosoma floridanum]|uniref:acyl-CoA Delta(11) desaturase-like n=1 Tax=Copidosoma floridanum TaxID=29053 RepID=UPI0006C9D67D|nr:acyl-CoA Delta(11) desaturase-like [Copidosoma floridanum]XP_014211748.1 acyl-CoA Delta(11) desaturase-like [Copidosoma floridanum]